MAHATRAPPHPTPTAHPAIATRLGGVVARLTPRTVLPRLQAGLRTVLGALARAGAGGGGARTRNMEYMVVTLETSHDASPSFICEQPLLPREKQYLLCEQKR